jgi:hypothetical protein
MKDVSMVKNQKLSFKNLPLFVFILIFLFILIYKFTLALLKQEQKPQKNKKNISITTEYKSLTPTSIQKYNTENWQTYRNEVYRFEFNYPPGWQEYGKMLKSPEGNFSLSILINRFGLECQQLVRSENLLINNNEVEKYTFQGIKSELCDNENQAMIDGVIKKENLRINLILDYKTSDAEIANDLFNQILTTFKFF